MQPPLNNSLPRSRAKEQFLLYTLMALQFTVIVDFMIMMPLSTQLMDTFAIQPAAFGVLVSAYSIAAGISALLAAALADRFDRRHALLVCYLGLTLATLECGLANSFDWLLIARIVAGFFGGVMSAIALAIVGDLIPQERRGKAMGIVMLAFSLAAIAGVPIGLWIATHYHWQTPFLFLVALCSIFLVVSWFAIPPVRGHLGQERVTIWGSYRALLSVPNHWWGFLTSSLVIFGGFMVIPYIAPALVANTRLTNADLPYIYFVGGAVTLLTRPYIAKMTDTYPHAQVLTTLTLSSFIPIVLVTHTPEVGLFWHLCIAALFFIFVSSCSIPCSAMVTASCQPELRGRVMAFNAAVQNLGTGLAAFTAGLLLTKDSSGHILHYDWIGYLACLVGILTIWSAGKIRVVS